VPHLLLVARKSGRPTVGALAREQCAHANVRRAPLATLRGYLLQGTLEEALASTSDNVPTVTLRT
jgi:hypothetical protein